MSSLFLRMKSAMWLAGLSILFSTTTFAQEDVFLSKSDIAKALTNYAKQNRFPSTLRIPTTADGKFIQGRMNYTFDTKVHDKMADVYLKYQPDYACFVAIDVETGAILNLTSFIKADEHWDNLVLRSEYPAASVFKLITAAASIDSGKLSPNSIIPYNGKSTSLYKSQVLRHKNNQWTRKPTLKESFAKSVNSVFGRIGVFDLGGATLREYAERFGFERALNSDFQLPTSNLKLNLDDTWQVAEAASGYTKDITLSPIHAAQLAAVIVNDGKMVHPYMVDSVSSASGQLLYKAQPSAQQQQVISSEAAQHMRTLMRETTRIGSASKAFSNLRRYKVYHGMEIGGKTGSLTGLSPKGRHDWFVGYAEKDGRKVAYASLIINKEKWYVRSAYVARQFIYNYFLDQPKDQTQDLDSVASAP